MNRQLGLSVADLAIAVIMALVLAEAMIFDVVADGPVRVLLGVPLALFLPGYAFVSALFPGDTDTERTHGIDWPERLALSFALSLALLPITLLTISAIPSLALTTGTIAGALAVIVVLGSVIAGRRRLSLPERERLSLPTPPHIIRGRSRSKIVVNLLLLGSILLAGTAVSYAFAAPQMTNSYTEFYLLHENPDGELVAGGYPSEIALGQSISTVVGIENQESAAQTYTVVVQLQSLEDGTVTERSELTRYETQVGTGDTAQRQLTITPQRAGEDLRVTYLLYQGSPPENPSSENAYRRLYVWVTVVEP